VKRYVAEPGSAEVRSAMRDAELWIVMRAAFVETMRALTLAGGPTPRRFASELPSFTVVEVDQPLCDRAATLAGEEDLRSLDALHLAAALTVGDERLVLATWDRRLWAAAFRRGLAVLPARL